ncbi:hypothetical protein BDV32DRAFT_120482 [Aspergillus pseudonomiae]|nr:hypothetical protein BDV32DRAFT_120482 [Aspergillus pseudonomiae]
MWSILLSPLYAMFTLYGAVFGLPKRREMPITSRIALLYQQPLRSGSNPNNMTKYAWRAVVERMIVTAVMGCNAGCSHCQLERHLTAEYAHS